MSFQNVLVVVLPAAVNEHVGKVSLELRMDVKLWLFDQDDAVTSSDTLHYDREDLA
jgi:hypothetical protein